MNSGVKELVAKLQGKFSLKKKFLIWVEITCILKIFLSILNRFCQKLLIFHHISIFLEHLIQLTIGIIRSKKTPQSTILQNLLAFLIIFGLINPSNLKLCPMNGSELNPNQLVVDLGNLIQVVPII